MGETTLLVADAGGTVAAGSDALLLRAIAATPLDDHVVGVPRVSAPRAPVLSCGGEGIGRAGPSIGELRHGGDTVIVRPAAGVQAVEGWLRAALDLKGAPTASGADVAPLLGLLWARAMDDASRHGPPA